MLPESLCQLKALRKLIIHYNLLELPDNIGDLISLEELQISYCYHLKMLPESLCQLKALRKLIIQASDCFLELPDNIGNLISLEELEINDCPKFVVLPESLCKLKILRKLNLIACKKLKQLPSDMENLTNLRTLKFSGIGVSSLPISLRKLSKLQTLNAKLKCNTIGWLKVFSENLRGALCLDGLANLSCLSDAQCANLASIDKLEYLILSWKKRIVNTKMYKNKMFMEFWRRFTKVKSCPQNIHENVLKLSIQKSQKIIEDHDDFSVVISLQPHPNLRELKIEGYEGNIFPGWIGNPGSCASLERIVIQWCQNLTELPFGSFNKLKYLKICECDRLSFLTAESLPLELEELIIEKNNMLISMPGILKLKYLVKLCITKCENLHSLVKNGEQMMYTNEVSYQNTQSDLRNLTSLRSLQIGWCPKLKELVYVKPCKIEVWDCPKLKRMCLQHSINYKDGEIRRDDIKYEEQEGEDLDTEGDDETEEDDDLDTGDDYETEEEEDLDTKDEFDAKEEVKEEEDEDLDLEDGFGLERRKNKRTRT